MISLAAEGSNHSEAALTDHPRRKIPYWEMWSARGYGDAAGVDTTSRMNDLIKAWGRVCLDSLAGAGLGAAEGQNPLGGICHGVRR